MSNLENSKQYVYPNKYLTYSIENERLKDLLQTAKADLDKALAYINELEKENKELMLNLAYRENVKFELEGWTAGEDDE
tara:strand:+ start:233 stop:469 length:237 start_codon:yes stop_codon:yes gene_type:complete